MNWFTSDQHFDHKNIIEYCNRPFADVNEMWEKIRDNWNKVVGLDDTVWVLGDFALYNTALGRKNLLDQLNGTKILIRGNHDGNMKQNRDIWHVVLERAVIQIGKRTVVLAHYPYQPDPNMEYYPKRAPRDNGLWLLCGHVHEHWKMKKKMINVGVDVWDFTPVSQDKLCQIMDKEEKK